MFALGQVTVTATLFGGLLTALTKLVYGVLVFGCLGFCLVGLLAGWFFYKKAKQPPPVSDNEENPKD